MSAECVIHSPHGLQVGDMALLESLNPEVKALALLHTTKESTYLRCGKANLGRKHGALVAEAVAARYCQVATSFICLAV
jgi:hypothetical protein